MTGHKSSIIVTIHIHVQSHVLQHCPNSNPNLWPFHPGNQTRGNRPDGISSQDTVLTPIIYFNVYNVLIATNNVVEKKQLNERLSLELASVFKDQRK